MIVNAALAIGLAPVIGWIAPAIATTAAGWVLVILLAIGGRRLGPVARFDARFRSRVWRVMVASILMGGALWGTMIALEPLLEREGVRYIALIVLIFVGILIYAAVGHAIGAFRLSEFRRCRPAKAPLMRRT